MPVLACNSLLPSLEVRRWNEIIKKHMLTGDAEQAIPAYVNMQLLGLHADNYTFPVLLKAAGRCASKIGFAFHGQIIKTGFYNHVFVQTALINMYGTLHCTTDAYKVFEQMPMKDLVAWNSILDAYASNGQMEDADNLFNLMLVKDLSSFNIMISGYSSCGEALLARSIFDKVEVKDIVSWNSMISTYIQAGDMVKARALFDEMPVKNTITWNTMITGCLQREHFSEALELFDEMKKTTNCLPDYLTVTSALSACAHLGSLETGTEIHIYAIDSKLTSKPHVTTALIYMYTKCGTIEQALQVFFKSQVKDIYCWNAIISGLALHGHGYSALKMFDKMRKKVEKPDDITFIGLLNACSHSGLVQQGCQLFDSMQEFGISPKLEHYGCMVDLLSRSGHLNHAFQVIEAMPFEPGESILGALLSACITHQDLETGERVVKLISCRAPCLSDGELIMFANLYASCGNWEEADRWREMMNDAGIVKTAGYSEIEVNGRFYKFLAGKMK